MHAYAFFDTALGRCAIAWGPRGIAAVELPGSDDRSTRRRILRCMLRELWSIIDARHDP